MSSAEDKSKKLAKKAKTYKAVSDKYKAGAKAEEVVEKTLEKLVNDNTLLVNDVMSHRGGNIDHILIAALGVFIIDTKNWKSKPLFSDSNVSVGKFNVTKQIDTLCEVASNVGETVGSIPIKVILLPLIDEEYSKTVSEVTYISLKSFIKYFSEIKIIKLTTEEIHLIHKITLDNYPKMGEKKIFKVNHTPVKDLITLTIPLYENLKEEERFCFIYITQWDKGTIKRSYITSKLGENLGYFDNINHIFVGEQNIEIENLLLILNGEKAILHNFANESLKGKNKMIKSIYQGIVGKDISHMDEVTGYIVGEKNSRNDFVNVVQVKFNGSILKIGSINKKTGNIKYFDENRKGLVNQFWYYFNNL